MNPCTRAEIRNALCQLPGLTPAVQSIVTRLADEAPDNNELGRLVFQEPAMAACVLQRVNSSLYGLTRQVGSLREAVTILGACNVRGVVLSIGLIPQFSDREAVSCSLATAAVARSLACSLKLDQGMAFNAGLLHNLGALLLGHLAPDTWQALDGGSIETMETRLLKERQTFGFDHCQLGADIAGQWHFPVAIQNAVRQHSQPSVVPVDALTDLLHVAWRIGSTGQSEDRPTISPLVLHRLGLETRGGEASLARAGQAAQDAHRVLGTL